MFLLFTVFLMIYVFEIFCLANAVIITAASTVDTKRMHDVWVSPVAAFESLVVPKADGICILSRCY